MPSSTAFFVVLVLLAEWENYDAGGHFTLRWIYFLHFLWYLT
jgi:hypothetical protein